MTASMRRIRTVLKSGREIDVVELGGERILTAFEHPALGEAKLQIELNWTTSNPDCSLDTTKVRCYWYMYVVSQKWTDSGEKGREGFNHFARVEKYGFSVFETRLAV
jgi:hypothetical protein